MGSEVKGYLRVSLLDGRDADAQCSLLGVEPTRTWSKDSMRGGRVHEASGFLLEVCESDDCDEVDAAMNREINRLSAFLGSAARGEIDWTAEYVLFVGGNEAYARSVGFRAGFLKLIGYLGGRVQVFAYPCAAKSV